MITISLCIIVRNEEETLARCLSSVEGIADEIIVVDTGSTDRTKAIAQTFTSRIYDFPWIDDFAAARNFAFSKATQEYIFWMDADDVIEEADRRLFIGLKQTLSPQVDCVTMPYHLAFDPSGNVTVSLRRNRLVRRDRQFQWIGPVHEYLAVGGATLHSPVAVTHKKERRHTDRNLRIYRKRQAAGEEFSPRDLYYFANELKDHGEYGEAAEQYERFLNTGKGWIEDNIQACLKLSECYEALKLAEQSFRSLCRILSFDAPRSEFCCRMGAFFYGKGQYPQAIFWFDLATRTASALDQMGMVDRTASTWYPHLQMCLCYDRMGQYDKASEHNERALAFRPGHPSMLYNRDYFRKLLGFDAQDAVKGERKDEVKEEEPRASASPKSTSEGEDAHVASSDS